MHWRCVKCGRALEVSETDFPINCCARHELPLGVISEPTRRGRHRSSPPVAPPKQPRTDCLHRGVELRREECTSCCGKTEIKVFGCELHGECTLGKALPGLACCETCVDFARYQPITVRNLIYHVCPLASNDGWRKNVRQLLKRIDVFNGRRIIAVVTGDGMEDISAVREAFGAAECEYLLLPNDKELREVATFLPLLEAVNSTAHDQATFYAHTKGNSTIAAGLGDDGHRAVMYWRNAMYHHLLDGADECMKHLENFPVVGCHKVMHPPQRSLFPTRLMHGAWMFAGTFYWFRNDIVFTNPKWRDVPVDRYGAEAWPAGLFEPWQGKSVFQLWPEYGSWERSPYDPSIYAEPITDEL